MEAREHKRDKDRAGSPGDRGPGTAFTLIELLVVVAVMGVVAALLLPAVAGVMRQVRSVQCLSNSRQWAAAAWMYGDEHEELFPYEGHFLTPLQAGANREAWYNVVPPYAGLTPLSEQYQAGHPPRPGLRSLFMCPEVRAGSETTPTLEKPIFTYGMNNRLDPNGPGRFRRAQLTRPEDTVVFTETQPQRFPSASGRYTPARHTRRANLAFADGHASAVLTNDYARTREEDRDSRAEWRVTRAVYWYPFAGAPL